MNKLTKIKILSKIYYNIEFLFAYHNKKNVTEQTFDDYITKVAKTKSDKDFYMCLMEFVNLYGDGHTYVKMPYKTRQKSGYFPFQFIKSENDYYISSKPTDSAVPLYGKIEKINDKPFKEFILELKKYIYFENDNTYMGNIISNLPLLLNKTNTMLVDGKLYTFRLKKSYNFKKINITTPTVCHNKSVLFCDKNIEISFFDNVLYIKILSFNDATLKDIFKNYYYQLKKADSVIFDVRDNLGGMTDICQSFAAPFFNQEIKVMKKCTRKLDGISYATSVMINQMPQNIVDSLIKSKMITKKEINDSINVKNKTNYRYYFCLQKPDNIYIEKPIIILTSPNSFSATCEFVAIMKNLKNVKIWGESPTCSTGTPVIIDIDDGGKCYICSVATYMADGTEFVGKGFAVDKYIVNTINDYKNNFDYVLNSAVEHLKTINI